MEEYIGRATFINMNKGVMKKESVKEDIDDPEHKKQLLYDRQSQIVSEVYGCIRDVNSTENVRAIQDSESPAALDQKRIIKILAQQGWSKNEIIYEVQRVFGNDVLISTDSLDEERSLFFRVAPKILIITFLASAYLYRRQKVSTAAFKQQQDALELKRKLQNKF